MLFKCNIFLIINIAIAYLVECNVFELKTYFNSYS